MAAGFPRLVSSARTRAAGLGEPGDRQGGVTVQAYCMKCREQRDMQNPKQITMKNGRPATEGTCGTCGTKLFKIGAPK